MTTSKKIGKEITKRRKLLELDIEDLSDYSDVTNSSISNNTTSGSLKNIIDVNSSHLIL